MSAVEAHRPAPAKRNVCQLATTLRRERPDYAYLKELFRQLRGARPRSQWREATGRRRWSGHGRRLRKAVDAAA